MDKSHRVKRKIISSNWWLLLITLPILFLAIFYLWPLISIVIQSFTEPPGVGFKNYEYFFKSETYMRVLFNTIRTAGIVTLVTLLIGYPYTYLIRHASRRISAILFFAVLLPFWSSLLVRTYAWTVILRDTGILNNILINLGLITNPLNIIRTPFAVQIGLSHVLLPFMVLPLYSVMIKIDPDYSLAARNLGASAFASFRRVFFPMSMSGVLAGSLLVFVLALGYYITPSLLGGPRDQMLSQLIVNQVSKLLDWGMGSTMAVMLTVITLAMIGIAGWVIKLPDIFGSSDRE